MIYILRHQWRLWIHLCHMMTRKPRVHNQACGVGDFGKLFADTMPKRPLPQKKACDACHRRKVFIHDLRLQHWTLIKLSHLAYRSNARFLAHRDHVNGVHIAALSVLSTEKDLEKSHGPGI